ncbi:hypothetical protein IRJ41_005802 [Triplophysa rosa]|uniref:Uncharacterized protein n=1 Tax=Triplophysa rosa TaxID=992332 RepID=A0A9W7WKY3_TRIRA|nr:hypothetical protein IRJ41_005802 [Triplophysa rosa]
MGVVVQEALSLYLEASGISLRNTNEVIDGPCRMKHALHRNTLSPSSEHGILDTVLETSPLGERLGFPTGYQRGTASSREAPASRQAHHSCCVWSWFVVLGLVERLDHEVMGLPVSREGAASDPSQLSKLFRNKKKPALFLLACCLTHTWSFKINKNLAELT